MLIQRLELNIEIATLAIHLDRQETFTFNKETQLFPIAGLVAAELNRHKGDDTAMAGAMHEGGSFANFSPLKAPDERHHPHVIELIANEIEVAPSEIVDFEMVLYDTQKPCIGGLNEELVLYVSSEFFFPLLDHTMSPGTCLYSLNVFQGSLFLSDK